MVALREAYEDRDSGIPAVYDAENRLFAWEGGNHFFPVVDGRQNIVGYLNTSGGWKQTVELDAFGNTINSSGTVSFPFGYKGYFRDLDSGMYYLGHRYYNPLTGRFLNRDPIGEAGGLNLYAHTANDHINLWDVLGLSPHDSFTAGDNSLWDQVMGIAGRLLSDAGLRHQRYDASNSWYELWLQTSVPIHIGSGTLQPRFTLRGPILRHSQQEPGGDWSGLRGQANGGDSLALISPHSESFLEGANSYFRGIFRTIRFGVRSSGLLGREEQERAAIEQELYLTAVAVLYLNPDVREALNEALIKRVLSDPDFVIGRISGGIIIGSGVSLTHHKIYGRGSALTIALGATLTVAAIHGDIRAAIEQNRDPVQAIYEGLIGLGIDLQFDANELYGDLNHLRDEVARYREILNSYQGNE